MKPSEIENHISKLFAQDAQLRVLAPSIDVRFNQPADEIIIKFVSPEGRATSNRVPSSSDRARFQPPQFAESDKAFILAAVKDAWEKNKRPFLSLRWLKTKYLPAVGAKFQSEELNGIISELVAQGALIIEHVPNSQPPFHDVTTVRTPDMPPAKDDSCRERLRGNGT